MTPEPIFGTAPPDPGAPYDVLVIGGGINGCGVARDCALRGLKVALVEKEDFGAGASGASSGFIHGGIRYLLSDRDVTRRSCEDSGRIQRIAPHLVKRVPIALPTRKTGVRGWFQRVSVEAFFSAYDRFAPLKNGKPHAWLTGRDLSSVEPGLARGLTGAAVTDEWWVDAPRLCWANAQAAIEAGADVRNHTRVEALLREGASVTGARVRDAFTGRAEDLRAKVVVNAAGPWLERVAGLAGARARIRPGKGIHLVLERRVSPVGFITEAVDGRQIFVIPSGNGSLVGTTDDDYYGDPDRLAATEDEVEYLLQGIETLFPAIRDYRIVRTTAGLRPTLFEYGPSEDELSRAHRVIEHAEAPGLVTIAGGKLAAYRMMAEEVSDAVCRRLAWKERCTTHRAFLPGGDAPPPESADPLVRGIARRHGSRAERVLELGRAEPRAMQPVCANEGVTEAEVRWCARHERVRTLGDLARRTGLGLGACGGADCAGPAACLLAEELGWDAATRERRRLDFLRERRDARAALPETADDERLR